jgi:uncharacterized protein YjbI with pentapeptide repeats
MEGCRWQESTFIECKLVGAEFFKCESKFFTIQVKQCFLQFCNFSGLPLKKTSFNGSKIIECYFTQVNLTECDFRDTDLSGSVFHESELSKADFRGARNYDIDVRNNKVKKAKFSFPEAIALLRNFEIEID